MRGLFVLFIVLALLAVVASLLAGVGGFTAVLALGGVAGAVYLLMHTRRKT